MQLAQLACQADLVLRVLRVLLERKEPLARKGPKVRLVVMVSRAPLVCLVPLDLRDHLEKTVTREK